MYKIGVVLASGELIAYPWINLKETIDSDKSIYEFVVFQQEQYERLFAEMRLGALDGVVFSSNVSNDERIRNLILSNRDTIAQFIKRGKGVLILLQYHLARKNQAFDIIEKNVFNDDLVTDRTDKYPSGDASLFDVSFINDVGSDEEREQNTVVQTDGKFDESKVYWNSESILLSYPNRIISRDIFYQSQNSRFAKSFAPAYISRYPHAYFVAPFCLEAINAQNSIQRKPLLIYSPNNERRIVITTLPADLQEHKLLLENMVSYIARGRPEAVLWKDASCGSCNGTCNTEDYLTRAKIHYFVTNKKAIENDRININRSKYVVTCGETAYSSYKSVSKKIALPVKTSLYSIASLRTNVEDFQKKIIVDVPAVSQIELWAVQGFNYLLERFPDNEKFNNKWDTLYATEQVISFASEIHQDIPAFISEQIENYLTEHNRDKKTFDKVENATQSAKNICRLLNIKALNFECKQPKEDIVHAENIDIDVSAVTLFDLAQLVLRVDDPGKLELIDDIIARFVTERDIRKAAWEDDVMTTACVLRALRRIDACETINTSLTNIICSCYDSENDLELTVSLSKSVERARQSEFNARKQMLNERSKFEKHLSEANASIIEKVNLLSIKESEIIKSNQVISDKEDVIESLKNKQLRSSAWLITLCGICAFSLAMFISYIIKAQQMDQSNYVSELIEFFMSWGIGEAILGVLSIVVTIVLFRVLYNSEIRKALKRDKRRKRKKDENNGNNTQEI